MVKENHSDPPGSLMENETIYFVSPKATTVENNLILSYYKAGVHSPSIKGREGNLLITIFL